MKLPLKSTALAVSALALLGAAGAAQAVEYANVVSATPVTGSFPVPRQQCAEGTQVVPAQPSGGGALIGAIIGGVVGNQFGSGTGRAAMTGAGIVGGAVAGNAIENRNRRDDEVYRVWVRMDNGGLRSFDFYRIDDLRVGDRVRYDGGQLYRY